jgi:hypothetical protein
MVRVTGNCCDMFKANRLHSSFNIEGVLTSPLAEAQRILKHCYVPD